MSNFVGQQVLTPYGKGVINRIRECDVVVIPTGWQMADGQKPTFFLNTKDVTAEYKVDDAVETPFGTGTITGVRYEDGVYIVRLKDWQLADGKSPTLYLNQSSISKPVQTEATPTPNNFTIYLEKALVAKQEATSAFKKGDLEKARTKYLDALGLIQHVKGEMTNEQKAQLFEQTVTCNNNLALCCMRTQTFPEASLFAKNALVLIKSLETKIPDGLIWKCLQNNGITLEKLLKEWKKKSLYYIGKSELKRQNFQEAVEHLEASLALIVDDPDKVANANELRELVAEATKKRNKEKKREKSTWSKAFKKNSASVDPPAAQNNSPSSSSRSAATVAGGESVPIDLSKVKVDLGLKESSKTQLDRKQFSSTDSYMGLLFGLGFAGILGGVAFWWLRSRRHK